MNDTADCIRTPDHALCTPQNLNALDVVGRQTGKIKCTGRRTVDDRPIDHHQRVGRTRAADPYVRWRFGPRSSARHHRYPLDQSQGIDHRLNPLPFELFSLNHLDRAGELANRYWCFRRSHHDFFQNLWGRLFGECLD